MSKLFPKDIKDLKNKRKITKVTGLNYFNAQAIEEAGIDIIGLDGPPVEIYYKGATGGMQTDLDELIFSLKPVRGGAPNTFIMVPIPFGLSSKETVATAAKLVKAGADAVKIEGAGPNLKKIEKIIEQGIPCVGTIGLNTEVSIYEGFRCIGKSSTEAVEAYRNALILQELGVIWIEVECMPYKVAKEITAKLKVPTIGIGSGSGCDGQAMHSEDLLGLHNRYYPKHCKKYIDSYRDSVGALTSFKKEVSESVFPGNDNSFKIVEGEFLKFKAELEKSSDAKKDL
jgi:3-methyl-2-oxobutanoate hydroxymethyltransferase